MCGVIGIIGPAKSQRLSHWAAYDVCRGLLTLQHRGQDAAGILSYSADSKRFSGKKELGLVSRVFGEEDIRSLEGNMAIGHTRYATVGSDLRGDLQPMVIGFPFGAGMVHNGNLLNYHSLGQHLREDLGLQFLSQSDLELLLYLWCHHLFEKEGVRKPEKITFEHIVHAAQAVMEQTVGAYALCGLMAGVGLVGMRDPAGIRPLVLGRREVPARTGFYDYCLCSETQALNFLGFDYIRDLAPAEVVLVDSQGQLHSQTLKPAKPGGAPCMFEWVYFSGAESSISGKGVYATRLNLGRILARKVGALMKSKKISPEIVCPVPDTSRTASIALAEELGLPYREGLIKNRYVQRSFILANQDARERAVELKLSPVISEIKGKRILLVDDSLVRGTTGKKIIALLKRYGASEVTLALSCPPLRYGCYYGIDFPSREELFANGRDLSEISHWMGADQVIYLDDEDLKEAIGLENICMACVNGDYPTSTEGAKEFCSRRREQRRRA